MQLIQLVIMNPAFLVYRSNREIYGCFAEKNLFVGKDGVKVITTKTTFIIRLCGKYFDISLFKTTALDSDSGDGNLLTQTSSISTSRRTYSESEVAKFLSIVSQGMLSEMDAARN